VLVADRVLSWRMPARLGETRDRALLVARAGDQLVVTKLDRLGRSLEHLIELARTLQQRQVGTEPPGSPVREALVELNQARTAAVRIGVAGNKLAAKALAGATVSAAELAAAAEAASRSVARVEAAAALVHRRLA